MDVASLIKQGEQSLLSFEPELALKFFLRALEYSPKDVTILTSIGDIYIQCGDPINAGKYFVQATTITNDNNDNDNNADDTKLAPAWLYLGQLRSGLQSLECYQKGIKLLEKLLQLQQSQTIFKNNTENNDILINKTKYEISSAYCTVTELYMTDLCYETDAEFECERNVNLALSLVPDNIDALLTLTSFHVLIF